MSVTRQQRAKMEEEKNGRGGEMPEVACSGERKRSGTERRSAAVLLSLPFCFSPPPFSPFADMSPTWPSSTSATVFVSSTCGLPRRQISARARMQKLCETLG